MCCKSNVDDVRAFLAQHKGQNFIRVFKILKVYQDSKVLSAPYYTRDYIPGESDFRDQYSVSSNRSLRLKREQYVDNGFHCYLDRKQATRGLYGNLKVVVFYVNPNDVIGVGGHHAVFSRAFLRKEEFDKAINR